MELGDGFTVITGPNGSGKSVFLESIAFGLGVPLSSLRVREASELCSSSLKASRVQVTLTFEQSTTDTMVVGCSIIEGSRIYYINKVKVKKQIFVDKLSKVLGFGHHSITWNIGQKAVQNIVSC